VEGVPAEAELKQLITTKLLQPFLRCHRKLWRRRNHTTFQDGRPMLESRASQKSRPHTVPARRLDSLQRAFSMTALKCQSGIWIGQAGRNDVVQRTLPRSHMPISCPNMGTNRIERSRNILGKRCRWCYSDQPLQGDPSDPSEYVRNETCVGSYTHRCLHRRRRCLVDF
jgi:hypothetical protein